MCLLIAKLSGQVIYIHSDDRRDPVLYSMARTSEMDVIINNCLQEFVAVSVQPYKTLIYQEIKVFVVVVPSSARQ